MAVSYKGLTVKFGGDTTQLSAALKQVSAEGRKTVSDLKDINRALKLDPGNTQLLEQKVRNLNKAYDETKTKLETYRKGLEQLEEKKRREGQLTEEEQRQYDALVRDIVKTEDQLERYGKQLKEVSKEHEASKTAAYQFGQTLQDNADGLASAGEKVQKFGNGTAAAFGGVAAAAVASFNEVDAGADAVIRQTGATGEAAEELQAVFEDVARQSSADWETIGNAVGDVNTRFHLAGEELEGTSLQFLRFSENCGIDVNTAIRDVSMSMDAFGVDASRASEVLGMFQYVAQDSGLSVDTLISSVNTNGAALREMGLSIDDAATLLGNFEAAGVPADQMLTGLKKAATNCAAEGRNLGDEMYDLTVALADPAREAEATQKAIDLFGSKSAMSFIDAAKAGRINLDELGAGLDWYAGKVDETFEATKDAPDEFTEALHELQIIGSDVGGALLESFVPAARDLAGLVGQITEAYRNLTPEQQQLVTGVILGGVAFGGLTSAIGGAMQNAMAIGEGFKALGGVTATLKGGVQGFWSVLSANPIVLVVGAIAAVVAALAYWFTQTEEGRAVWGEFCEWFQGAWQAVSDFMGPLLEGIAGFFSGLGDFLGAVFGPDNEARAKAFSDAWEGAKGLVGDAMEGVKGFFSDLGDSIGGWVSDCADRFGRWREDCRAATEAIKADMGQKWDSIRDKVASRADEIGQRLGFPGLGDRVRGVFDGVKRFMEDPIGAAGSFIKDQLDRIGNWFSGLRLELPKIKLPHFSIQGSFSLDPPSIPHIGVDWYAKGGIFPGYRPTLIGVGDNPGGEAVLPIDRLSDLMARAMDMHSAGQAPAEVTVQVSVAATVGSDMDARRLGQEIGTGVRSVLKQRGVSA